MKRLLFSLLLVIAVLSVWADNNVTVSYNGNTATVTVDDNVAQYLTVTQSGAHVSIVQGAVTEETENRVMIKVDGFKYSKLASPSNGILKEILYPSTL